MPFREQSSIHEGEMLERTQRTDSLMSDIIEQISKQENLLRLFNIKQLESSIKTIQEQGGDRKKARDVIIVFIDLIDKGLVSANQSNQEEVKQAARAAERQIEELIQRLLKNENLEEVMVPLGTDYAASSGMDVKWSRLNDALVRTNLSKQLDIVGKLKQDLIVGVDRRGFIDIESGDIVRKPRALVLQDRVDQDQIARLREELEVVSEPSLKQKTGDIEQQLPKTETLQTEREQQQPDKTRIEDDREVEEYRAMIEQQQRKITEQEERIAKLEQELKKALAKSSALEPEPEQKVKEPSKVTKAEIKDAAELEGDEFMVPAEIRKKIQAIKVKIERIKEIFTEEPLLQAEKLHSFLSNISMLAQESQAQKTVRVDEMSHSLDVVANYRDFIIKSIEDGKDVTNGSEIKGVIDGLSLIVDNAAQIKESVNRHYEGQKTDAIESVRDKLEFFITNGIVSLVFVVDGQIKQVLRQVETKDPSQAVKIEEKAQRIERELQELFQEAGLEEITVNKGVDRYDVNIHEPARWVTGEDLEAEGKEDVPQDTIVGLLNRGFIYNNKLLSRARVIVRQ